MENSKLSDVKGKELVAAGHAFAKAIGMDTPLIEIAKIVSVLATRLDCALVRGDALAAENMALRNAHPQPFGPIMMQALDAYEKDREQEPETGMLNAFFILRDSINIKTPATDAYLNSVRADTLTRIINTGEFSNWVNQGLQVWVNRFNANSDAQLRAIKESM